MSVRSIEQGIEAIRSGNLAEGARLIRIALRDERVQGPLRATAYLWLAETKNNREAKLACYNEALAADPGNKHAHTRISLLLQDDLPPVPVQPDPAPPKPSPPAGMPGMAPSGGTQPFDTQSAPATPSDTQTGRYQVQSGQTGPLTSREAPQQTPNYNPNAVYRVVGIYGGPNGRGSGFFITRDGLIATTRHVVGGEIDVVVELEPGSTLQAQVVRSFPELDIAFLHTGLTVNRLLQGQASPVLPDNMPLTAFAHGRRAMSGYVRGTRSETKADWFPTTIGEKLNDAGGNPIFNDHNVLVGMLTHNANRTSPYVYGVNINSIYRFVEHYAQEARAAGGQLVYCPGCGALSRAATVGGYYCEMCGSVLTVAENTRRSPMPQLAAFYGETRYRPCPNCNSRVGYFNDTCLRCGYEK